MKEMNKVLTTKQIRLTYTPSYNIFMNERFDIEKIILVQISSVLQNNLSKTPLKIEIEKIKADNTNFSEDVPIINGSCRYSKKDKIEYWTPEQTYDWLEKNRFTYIITCEVEANE